MAMANYRVTAIMTKDEEIGEYEADSMQEALHDAIDDHPEYQGDNVQEYVVEELAPDSDDTDSDGVFFGKDLQALSFDKPAPRVIVSISGGVLDLISKPEDVELEVREYDDAHECPDDCAECSKDERGKRYHVWVQ